jgi:hypothetical protein
LKLRRNNMSLTEKLLALDAKKYKERQTGEIEI